MFGIGSTELLVILVVALIVLGPGSLAKVSRSLGKMVGEFRRVSTDFQRTLNLEAAEQEARERKAAREAEKNARVADSHQDHASSDLNRSSAGSDDPPPDSPLGQAIARAKAEAAGRINSAPSPQSGNDSKNAE